MKAIGEISICLQSKKTGKTVEILRQKNLILYEAADIMSMLVKGRSEYRVSHMYFQYQNTVGTPVQPSLTKDLGRSDFDSITGADKRDWLRVPIITEPLIDSSDEAVYENNQVTFTASSASSASLTGESPAGNVFSDTTPDGPSKIYSLALVSTPTISDNTKDRIFSRVNPASILTVQAGHHVTVFWRLRFL